MTHLIIMYVETLLFGLGPLCVYVCRSRWFVILLTIYGVVMSIVISYLSSEWSREACVPHGDGISSTQSCIPGARTVLDTQWPSNTYLLKEGALGIYSVVHGLIHLSFFSKQDMRKHIQKPASFQRLLSNSSGISISGETLLPEKCVLCLFFL